MLIVCAFHRTVRSRSLRPRTDESFSFTSKYKIVYLPQIGARIASCTFASFIIYNMLDLRRKDQSLEPWFLSRFPEPFCFLAILAIRAQLFISFSNNSRPSSYIPFVFTLCSAYHGTITVRSSISLLSNIVHLEQPINGKGLPRHN